MNWNNLMYNKSQFQLNKPSIFAEKVIVENILNGKFPSGSELPNQRKLAIILNVARPSLREALMRLERDGWISINHGKPTRVLDIWKEGGLNILRALIEQGQNISTNQITELLEVRLVIAPVYAISAINKHPHNVLELLKKGLNLDDLAEKYAKYDWEMHYQLTLLSDNFVYPLLLNSFAQFYSEMAKLYYSNTKSRLASKQFHLELFNAVKNEQFNLAETIFSNAMSNSIYAWRNMNIETNKGELS